MSKQKQKINCSSVLYMFWFCVGILCTSIGCGASATLYPKSDVVFNNKIIKAITDVTMSLYLINSEVCLLNYYNDLSY